jgi:hypothetical protein
MLKYIIHIHVHIIIRFCRLLWRALGSKRFPKNIRLTRSAEAVYMNVCVCVCVFYTSITPARSTRYRVRGGPRSLTTIIVIIIVFGSSRVARLCACRISGVVLHVAPHNARDSVCHTFRRIIISYTYSISRLARVHHHIHTHTHAHTHTHMLAQPILSRKFRHWNINRSPRGFFFYCAILDKTFFEYLQW